MNYQELREIVLCSFKTGLKPGTRGKQIRDLNEINGLIQRASVECIKIYMYMHTQVMSFGSEITTRATGQKGLILDYHVSNSHKRGTRFGALGIRPMNDKLVAYFHGLKKTETNLYGSIKIIPEESSGVPHTWFDPYPDQSEDVLKLLKDSYQHVIEYIC